MAMNVASGRSIKSDVSRGVSGKSRRGSAPRALVRPCHSGGYTLLELLLVLTILVCVAGAVAPTVVARMAEYRLKQGAESARFALSATRIHAIDLSSVYQFRFEPGGRRYLAVPTDADAVAMAQKSNSASGGLPSGSYAAGQLPEDISFAAVAVATKGAPALTTTLPAGATDGAWSQAVTHVPNAGEFNSAAWSAPIVFRPDGTAIESAVNVVDKNGNGFQLKVRELTGEVFITRLETGTL
jgi:type II secretory pathway pseudopilin PulG